MSLSEYNIDDSEPAPRSGSEHRAVSPGNVQPTDMERSNRRDDLAAIRGILAVTFVSLVLWLVVLAALLAW